MESVHRYGTRISRASQWHSYCLVGLEHNEKNALLLSKLWRPKPLELWTFANKIVHCCIECPKFRFCQLFLNDTWGASNLTCFLRFLLCLLKIHTSIYCTMPLLKWACTWFDIPWFNRIYLYAKKGFEPPFWFLINSKFVSIMELEKYVGGYTTIHIYFLEIFPSELIITIKRLTSLPG